MNKDSDKLKATPAKKSAKASPRVNPKPCFRDMNEDDDGYHPYADRQAEDPFFEEDPWR